MPNIFSFPYLPIMHWGDITGSISNQEDLQSRLSYKFGSDPGEISQLDDKPAPIGNDLILIEDSEDDFSKKKAKISNLPGSSGGEANTASNVGSAGAGVFKQKAGVDLEFKKLNAGSTKVTVTDDTENNEIVIDLDEDNFTHNHDSLYPTISHNHDSSYSAIGHNHAGVYESSNANIQTHIGISDGNPHGVDKSDVGLGNVTNDAQLKRSDSDFTSFGEKGVPIGNDIVLIEDSEASYAKKKIKFSSLPGFTSGESNTASNVGTAGVGVFKQKTDVDLEFKKLNAGSTKVTVTDDTENDEIVINVNEGNFTHNHDSLYSPISHNHDSSYSAIGHNHSGTYEPASSNIQTHIAATNNPHNTTKTHVGLGNVTDDAQLKRAAGDIASFTEKTTFADNDVGILEDSADSNAKKHWKFSSLWTKIKSIIFKIDAYQLWLDLSGTYASASTFTYTCADAAQSDNDAKKYLGSLFTCTDSGGSTRRVGYVKSVNRSTTTMTVTVVSDSDLASGDKDIKVTPTQKLHQYRHLISIPSEQIADANNPQGTWLLDIKFDSYLLPVDSAVRTAAQGSGASLAWNVYSGATNLFSAAQDMATNTTYNERRPNIIAIAAASNVSARVTSSAGATNKANDLQIKLYIVPQHLFTAF